MNAKDFLKSKGDGESPYGEVIWNFNKASNEWLADLLEEFLQLNTPNEVQSEQQLPLANTINWVAVSERLPELGKTVLVYCKIYGRFLATYEYIGDFEGKKYGNWRDFNGNLGILPPAYWLYIPEPPCL